MTFRSTLLAATVGSASLAAIPAFAQPVTGPYVSLGVGGSYQQDRDLKSFSDPALGVSRTFNGRQGSLSSDAGLFTSGSLGYGLGNGLRLELQGDWRDNKIHQGLGFQAGGESQEYGGFVNALYDFDLTPYGAPGLSPYVGVGAGYEQVKFNNGKFYGANTFIRSTSDDGDFAVQGIVGLAYNIAQVPGLALTAEYRFTTVPSDLSYTAQVFQPRSISRANFTTEGTYNHAGLIGLRYALFAPVPPAPPAPAPAPVAAPAPEPARTYLVFFDWDRADLTARARQIIGAAAQSATRVQTTRIEVNGYTDLSGTAKYNQGLSVRRAKSVEAELIRDGVQRGEISIHGYGESNPLVQTAQGVREPQNRRVEIILK